MFTICWKIPVEVTLRNSKGFTNRRKMRLSAHNITTILYFHISLLHSLKDICMVSYNKVIEVLEG